MYQKVLVIKENNSMKPLLALCLVSCIICSFQVQNAPSFEQYLNKYDKKYVNSEIQFRRELYNQNVQKLQQKKCTTCVVDNFTDWTDTEKKQLNIPVSSDKLSDIREERREALTNKFSLRLLEEETPQRINQADKGSRKSVSNQFGFCFVSNCKVCQQSISSCQICEIGHDLIQNNGAKSCESWSYECQVYDEYCDICNEDGVCVLCLPYFKLNEDNLCAYGCDLQNCSKCSQQTVLLPKTCSQCIKDLSINLVTYACQSNQIQHCHGHMQQRCMVCDSAYSPVYNTDFQIIQCDSSGCLVSDCKQCSIKNHFICLQCQEGYILSQTLNQANLCLLFCQVQNCLKCNQDVTSCQKCSPLYQYNTESNKCEIKWNIFDCSDVDNCVICYSSPDFCNHCVQGYLTIQQTGQCLEIPFQNCMLTIQSKQLIQCLKCEDDYILDLKTWQNCIPASFYETCQEFDSQNDTCIKCINGYYLTEKNIEGQTECIQIQSLIPNCWIANKLQDHCLECFFYNMFNEKTQICEPITDGCAQKCEKCHFDQNGTMVECLCQQGYLFDSKSLTCVEDTLNVQNCIQINTVNSQKHVSSKCSENYLIYFDEISSQFSCIQKCSVNNCLYCQYQKNNECKKCQKGHFKTASSQCQKCLVQFCSSCEEINCLSCLTGYKLDIALNSCKQITCPEQEGWQLSGSDCICSQGHYFLQDQQINSCVQCSTTNCLQCFQDICSDCDSGYYLTDQNQCSSCTLDKCEECKDESTCQVCMENYFFSSLSQQCIEIDARYGAFFDYANGLVKACPTGCLQCEISGACSSCEKGYSLLSSLQECQKCSGNCKTCYPNVPQMCKSCFSGYFLKDQSCAACDDLKCIKCQTSQTICTKCAKGYNLQNNICTNCPENCQNCDDSGVCLSCKEGFAIIDSQCVPCIEGCGLCNSTAIQNCLTCLNGNYKDENNACIICPENCKTCSNSNTCLSCEPNYYIRQGLCYEPCHTGCKTCGSDSQICSQCFGGYNLSATNKCTMDISCNSDSSCVACPQGYALQNSKCVQCTTLDSNCIQCRNSDASTCAKCQEGYYLQNNQCKNCNSKCQQCSTINICSVCSERYFLSKSTDQESSNKCQQCSQNCKTCEQLADKCKSCKSGFSLTGTGSCVSSNQFELTMTLDMDITDYTSKANIIRKKILQSLGTIFLQNLSNLIIKSLMQGSTIIVADVAVPQGQNAVIAYSNLAATDEIDGIQVTSISSTGTGSEQQCFDCDESSNIGLIVGLVVGCIALIAILIAVAIFYRVKKLEKIKAKVQENNNNRSDVNIKDNASKLHAQWTIQSLCT